MTTFILALNLLAPSLLKAQSCSSHDDCPSGDHFCYSGNQLCWDCAECHYCADGVDGTCGSCGDGYPICALSDFEWEHNYDVFGVQIVGTEGVNATKFMHAVHVLFQYLDNDEDGEPDDPEVITEMIASNATLAIFVDADEQEEILQSVDEESVFDGAWQNLYDEEIIINSCSLSVPYHNASGCNERYDATLEEVLHLITGIGVSPRYPATWGESDESTVAGLLLALNGDCGWGFSGDWINPNSSQCDGVYAYVDETCGLECIVTEGIYWALTSVLGSQNYTERAQ